MQHPLSYRITAIFMAVLLLSSSVSFSMDMHFCQGKLKSISLIGKAKSCHEVANKPVCPHHKAAQKNCCNNKQVTVEQSDDDYTASSPSLEFSPLQLAAPLENNFVIRQVAVASCTQYLHYKPPNPDRDRCVIYQSFLI